MAWQDRRALHTWATTGRLLGLAGAALLAQSIAHADAWPRFQDTWERAVPFGLLVAIFLGAGVSPEFRRAVFPVVGVAAAIAISLFTNGNHAGELFSTALVALGVGGVVLGIGLQESKDETIGWTNYPTILLIVAFGLGFVLELGRRKLELLPFAAWCLSVLGAGLLATMWEVWDIRVVETEAKRQARNEERRKQGHR